MAWHGTIAIELGIELPFAYGYIFWKRLRTCISVTGINSLFADAAKQECTYGKIEELIRNVLAANIELYFIQLCNHNLLTWYFM